LKRVITVIRIVIIFSFFFILFEPVIINAHGKNKSIVQKHNDKKIKALENTINKKFLFSLQKPETFTDWILIKIPTKHPIVVHFPIILLIISFPFFIIGVFFKKEDFRLLAVITCGVGFLGGMAATYLFHPHPSGLTVTAAKALEYHEFFARTTLIISGIATFTSATTILKTYRYKIIEYITSILLFLSIISVSITGHFGGTLAYVYGIGVDGKYLDIDSH
jgi:uncharacterized membrane protein